MGRVLAVSQQAGQGHVTFESRVRASRKRDVVGSLVSVSVGGYAQHVSYPFEDLDDSQFERVVVQCMRKLFGVAVQGFGPGPDGGRDARFQGTAARFPSEASPWRGLTVGQAKHTAAVNGHFGEPRFGSDAKTSILSVEIGRLNKLKAKDEFDFYILFGNRRLGGNVGPALEGRVAAEVGLDKQHVHFVGI
jgi:hypothetical protein